MKIKKLEKDIVQIPSKENGYHAIVTVRIETYDSAIFQEVVEVRAASNRAEDTHNLITVALDRAEELAFASAKALHRQQPCNDAPNQNAEREPFAAHDATSTFQVSQGKAGGRPGGGAKPMSDKQREMIINIAQKRGIDHEGLSVNLCGKRFDLCRGEDADKLIKYLKNEQYLK